MRCISLFNDVCFLDRVAHDMMKSDASYRHGFRCQWLFASRILKGHRNEQFPPSSNALFRSDCPQIRVPRRVLVVSAAAGIHGQKRSPSIHACRRCLRVFLFVGHYHQREGNGRLLAYWKCFGCGRECGGLSSNVQECILHLLRESD